MNFRLHLLSLFCPLFVVASIALAVESSEKTIDYLIDYVAKSKVTFIRNGTEHTPAQAVEHIKAKYSHFKTDIKTPEDFIRLCASKSLLSGQPYKIRIENGKEMRLDEWLTNALKAHRGESADHL